MDEIDIKRKIELKEVFKISRMKERIKPTVPHKHDAYFEIIYLSDGAGVHTVDDVDHEVKPPQIFFLNPGQVHCWEFTKIPKGFVCIFKEEFLDLHWESVRHLRNIPPVVISNEGNLSLADDLELLTNEFKSDSPDIEILKSYLNLILLKIKRSPHGNSEMMNTLNPIIAGYKDLVDNYYLEQKDLTFYADELKVTKRKLSDLCKKELGRPASSLINERMIMESKRLLKHTTNSISEIAYKLNFHDPSYFVKFFKSNTNLTPGDYRSQIK